MLSHTWSLAIEEQFYLLSPFTFAYVLHKNVGLARSLIDGIRLMWRYRLFLVFVFTVSMGLSSRLLIREQTVFSSAAYCHGSMGGKRKNSVRLSCNGPIPAAITAFALVASIVPNENWDMYVDSSGSPLIACW